MPLADNPRPMRRAFVAVLLATTVAALPLAAFAADLRSELIAPAGDGWQEQPVGVAGEGPVTLDAAAQNFRSPDYARGMLHTAGFEAGYDRTWVQESTHYRVLEHAYLFGNAFGAGFWLGTVKGGDEKAAEWRETYDTSAITNSFGGYRVLPDGTYQTVVEFVPNDRAYAVIVSSPDSPKRALAMDLASQIRDAAPVEVATPGGAAAVGRVVTIVVGVVLALALVAAVVIILAVRRSSRRQPEPIYPAGPVLSPDGHWWWDGYRWQPVDRR